MSVESQAERVARFKRGELVEAAVAELVEAGWSGLQMKTVALRAGVSRQTVYNSFGGRDGLAKALIEHLTESFLDGFEAQFLSEREPLLQWTAGIAYVLQRGLDDPALRAMLGADSGDQFLHLLTSRSAPLLTAARARIAAVAVRASPQHVEPALADLAAELITRMALSNIVQPMTIPGDHAAAMATMVTAYLRQGPDGAQPPGERRGLVDTAAS